MTVFWGNHIEPSVRGALLAAATGAVLVCTAVAEPYTERVEVDGDSLVLTSVVGRITLESHAGSSFEITAEVRGEDAAPRLVTLQVSHEEGAAVVVVAFPEDERRYVYPELPRRSRTSFRLDASGASRESVVDDVLRRSSGRRYTVSGRGRGMELWADVVVRVPAGRGVTVHNGVGVVVAEGMGGPLDLSTRWGDVEVRSQSGDLRVSTGNGDLEVVGAEGSKVDVDTGNGHVDVNGVRATDVRVDTGNGRVSVDDVQCEELHVDTGNGSVDAIRLEVGEVRIDTGNGSVDVDLASLGAGPVVIDTGNGGISLRLPPEASADVAADSGHGRVHVDLDEREVDFQRKRRDEVRFRLGDGRARVHLETGHGSIEIMN